MRPDSTPTDPRLFPTEVNHTAELDAKALDEIRDALAEFKMRAAAGLVEARYGKGASVSPDENYSKLTKATIEAVRKTGRVI